jgi:catechol 2,3-dioxygenase-like lactoylglutathione lyase family enzyme
MFAALTAAGGFAQLEAPNPAGVRLGHIHLAVKDVAEQERFWVDMMGGTAVKNGPLSMIQFPGVYIMLRKAEPSEPPAGSIVDHFGFVFQDLPGMLAKWKAAGLKVDQTVNPNQGYVSAPDGVQVEFFGKPSITAPVMMDHIHFYAKDASGMQKFYADVFGLAAGRRPRVTTPGWIDCVYLPGGSNLSFSPFDTVLAPTKGRSLDHIGFDVVDLDIFAARLEKMGLHFDAPPRPIAGSKTRVAFLTDPWGTYIEVTEKLAP